MAYICKGFALLATRLQIKRRGLHFCADPGQNLERVQTFGKGLQRVRTFGHGLARNLKGFAFLGTVSTKFGRVHTFGENSQRVRTFVMGSQRVRTFGYGLAKNSAGFALLAKIQSNNQ